MLYRVKLKKKKKYVVAKSMVYNELYKEKELKYVHFVAKSCSISVLGLTSFHNGTEWKSIYWKNL